MYDTQALLHHWHHTWAALQCVPAAGLFDELLQAYRQQQRHYHTLQHLGECLQLHTESAHLAQHPADIGLALWFHDAVYDVHATDNEARSADWAAAALHTAGASTATQQHVHALIMATEHTAAPMAGDAALLADIDLAILGAAPARFAEYERQIRQEYAWVPEDVFTEKRQAVLHSFNARPRIYSTDLFYDRLEAPARANLKQALGMGGRD